MAPRAASPISTPTRPSPPDGIDDDSPPLRSLSDLSFYELHIRDFSVNDPTVPAAHRGMYEAFDDQNSNGMKHLRSLANSGLKAVHILPSFHFASINEDKSTWQITGNLSRIPARRPATAGRRHRHPDAATPTTGAMTPSTT